MKAAAEPVAVASGPADEEMREERPATGQKNGGNVKGGANKVKGIPRKALKNLINKEFEK